MYCHSPTSDVVEKAIPFSISLNMQQNSPDQIDYWYYNKPSITKIVPDKGPDDGGTDVLLLGNNFDPFHLYSLDNHVDTFCNFEGLRMVPANVINSNKIVCTAPPSYVKRDVNIEITLNNQQFTDDNIVYHYYKPPYIFDLQPQQGPTAGTTEVYILVQSQKEKVEVVQCKFGEEIVVGEFEAPQGVRCVAPKHLKPGPVPVSISFNKDNLWSSSQVSYLYYDKPIVDSIEPTCGPEHGYTQITVFGKNFVDLGVNKV